MLQEEKEEVATAKVAALSEKEKITGLLSRAFRQPPPRSASLHNLLDLQHDDDDSAVQVCSGPCSRTEATLQLDLHASSPPKYVGACSDGSGILAIESKICL